MVDTSRLQVEAAVSLTDVGRVKVGRPARVRLAGESPEGGAGAKVQSMPAALNAATGTAPVRLALDAAAHLTPGAPVQVEIEAEEQAGAVVVPSAALVRDDAKVFVYVVDGEKKAHRHEVTPGIEGHGQVEIRSGVKAGDLVVVKGQRSLPDGAAVAIGP